LFFSLEYIRWFFIFLESVLAFYALGGTATSPSLGHEPCHSPLPQLLVVSQNFVFVLAACFILGDSQSWRLWADLSVPQKGRSQSASGFRLTASTPGGSSF